MSNTRVAVRVSSKGTLGLAAGLILSWVTVAAWATPPRAGLCWDSQVIETDRLGRWTATCEPSTPPNLEQFVDQCARNPTGNSRAQLPTLRPRGYPAIRFESYLGSDVTGRYVALRKAGKLVVRDMVEATELELEEVTATDATNPHSPLQSQGISFGKRGQYLAWLSGASTNQAKVMLLDLPNGTRRQIDLGPGRAFGALLSDSEDWLSLIVVRRDSNKNGKLEAPDLGGDLWVNPCSKPVRFDPLALNAGPDAIERLIVPVHGGKPRRVDQPVTFFGKNVVVRAPDGRYSVEDGHGRTLYRLPPSCNGDVVLTHAATETLLVQCSDGDAPARPTRLVRFKRDAGETLQGVSYSLVRQVEPNVDWIPLRSAEASDSTVMLHLPSGRLAALPTGASLCEVRSDAALAGSAKAGTSLVFLNAGSASSFVSRRNCAQGDALNVAGDFTRICDELFNWREGRVTSQFADMKVLENRCQGMRQIRAIDSVGRALLAPISVVDWARAIRTGISRSDSALREFSWVEGVAR